MELVKDWRGTPIKVGSVVVYPSRQSSNLWVNEATVVSVAADGTDWRGNTILKIGVRRTKTGGYSDDAGTRVSYPDYRRITVVG